MAPTFNAIGLAVADMATSLAFYRRLGLDIPVEADSHPHVEAELPGGIRLMWDTHELIRSFDPDFTPGAVGGPSLAFLCADPAEVDRIHAALATVGQSGGKEPWDAEWGQRYAVVRDPDGYGIDLFAWVKAPQ
jgi:catechol 2,3-dioxygenase-like lactoylglutathione lyase family enzyme